MTFFFKLTNIYQIPYFTDDRSIFSFPQDAGFDLSSTYTYSPDEFNTRCKMSGQYPSADELDITENGVLKLLTSINPNKAAWPDNIKPKLLKELATEIAPILTIIFRKSFDTGEVPSDWRNANVSPVFKKGEKYKAENSHVSAVSS